MSDVILRPLSARDAPRLLELRRRNAAFLQEWEPRRDPDFLTLETQRRDLQRRERERAAGAAYCFGIFDAGRERLIGRVDLSGVVLGAFRSTHIGIFVGQEDNGRGHATRAIRLATAFAFGEAKLHRVQAAIMPHNARSLAAFGKAGFRREGLALRYLEINGAWRDHVLLARTVEDADQPADQSRATA